MRRFTFVALLLASATGFADAQPTGYTVLGGELQRIVLGSGEMTALGILGEPGEPVRVTGLAFDLDGNLYGIDRLGARLLRIDTTGGVTEVGPLGIAFERFSSPDITFDACGLLWLTTGSFRSDVPSKLYSLDPTSGAATLVGSLGLRVLSLTARDDRLLGVAGDDETFRLFLVDIDPLTAATSSPRPLEPVPPAPPWIDYDASGILWGLNTGEIISPPPGVFSWVVDARSGGLSDVASLGFFLDFAGLAVAPPSGNCGPGRCRPGESRHCLNDRRFQAEVEWRDFQDLRGQGRTVPGASDDSGLFWFFAPDNWELQVKVLDGCALNGHFWVLAAASTDVEYLLRVTDAATGEVREYANPLGQKGEAVLDTTAFATCFPEPGP